MTETNTPAPTWEETEAALANMDPRTANILRRRMGLAPALPEPPKGEPAPETSAGAALREQLADLAATVPAIDSEARQRLDAEIAEKAHAKAKQEAAEAAKRAERDRRESEAVTAALEPIKVRARALSPVKNRLIGSSVNIRAEVPDDVLYQHSVFCQTVLPYRDPGPDVLIWEREQGRVSLSLQAGRAKGPQGGFVQVGLPYGPTARLILCHLNTTALQTQNRVIDIDGSFTAFVRRLQGYNPSGPQIARTKEQVLRLAGCNITIAYDLPDRTIQVNSRFVTAFDLWEEDHEGERRLAAKTILLSQDYFESLQAHAVPLDERAVAALAHSAMGLDLYMWLGQRLYRIPLDRPQFIPWTALYAQFGQGYNRIRNFRRDFKTTLTQVLTQYPDARVKLDKGGMWLAHSPPPVPSRRAILLPSAQG